MKRNFPTLALIFCGLLSSVNAMVPSENDETDIVCVPVTTQKFTDLQIEGFLAHPKAFIETYPENTRRKHLWQATIQVCNGEWIGNIGRRFKHLLKLAQPAWGSEKAFQLLLAIDGSESDRIETASEELHKYINKHDIRLSKNNIRDIVKRTGAHVTMRVALSLATEQHIKISQNVLVYKINSIVTEEVDFVLIKMLLGYANDERIVFSNQNYGILNRAISSINPALDEDEEIIEMQEILQENQNILDI